MRAWRWWAAAVLVAGTAGAGAAEVQVAVAANLSRPMQRIAAAFARDTGHTLVMATGSTGKFYAQITSGAPFEVLLAADDETPARLVQQGAAVADQRFTFAIGRLALWSAQPGMIDSQGQVLRTNAQDRLAIADPKLAPYGAAAMEALGRLGLATAWQPRLVQGESITQAYQFVATGNARLGLVALSQVMEDGRIAAGSAWVVPQALHTPLRQDAVLLNPGRGKPAALALLQYLRGDSARAVFRAHGYEMP